MPDGGDTDPAGAGEPLPTPMLEVTDPGPGPRRSLRLDATEGDEFAASPTVRFGLEQGIDGETASAPMPVVRYTMAFSVTEVDRAGLGGSEGELHQSLSIELVIESRREG